MTHQRGFRFPCQDYFDEDGCRVVHTPAYEPMVYGHEAVELAPSNMSDFAKVITANDTGQDISCHIFRLKHLSSYSIVEFFMRKRMHHNDLYSWCYTWFYSEIDA